MSGVENPKNAMKNPFMDPFKNSDVPVLILNSQIDEMLFKHIGMYKGMNIINVESGYDEIMKDLKLEKSEEELKAEREKEQLPEDDVTSFCLWIKE